MNPYHPPVASAPFLAGLDFSAAVPIAESFLADARKADKGYARRDPSAIDALLKLASGAVFWSAKLAVDADGVGGKELDPEDGQNQTSLYFADGTSLDSRRHPYYVLPLGGFRYATGLQLGDVGVLIYGSQITAFAFGDLGPHDKLGEASICAHEGLMPAAPDPCHRDAHGQPTRIIDASIERDVLVVAFPRSALRLIDLTPDNFEVQVKAHAYDLFSQIHGKIVL